MSLKFARHSINQLDENMSLFDVEKMFLGSKSIFYDSPFSNFYKMLILNSKREFKNYDFCPFERFEALRCYL